MKAGVQKETKSPPARGDGQSGVTAGKKMHAGDGRKGVGRRAQGVKIPAGRGEIGKAE